MKKKLKLNDIPFLLVAMSAGIDQGLVFFNAIPAGVVPDSVKVSLMIIALGFKVAKPVINYFKS